MLQFLDACWLYADKSMLEKLYMFPIVMSRASGEKEAAMSLSNAWEMLGGKSCNGLAAYVADPVEFELNAEYQAIFEKRQRRYTGRCHRRLRPCLRVTMR